MHISVISVTMHLYVKGPGSKALNLHVDTDDVFNYQLGGCNLWEYCHPPLNTSSGGNTEIRAAWPLDVLSDAERAERFLLNMDSPACGPPNKRAAEKCTECSTFLMTPGDAQYVPRATFHRATASECPSTEHGFIQSNGESVIGLPRGSSVHLTIEVVRSDAEWLGLLEEALESAGEYLGLLLSPGGARTGFHVDIWSSDMDFKHGKQRVLASAKRLLSWRRHMPTWILRSENPQQGLIDDWNLLLRELELEIPPYYKNYQWFRIKYWL